MTDPNDRVRLLEIAELAARAAGVELLRSFESELLGVQWKTWQGERTVVTDADFAADRAIREVLAERAPDHTVYSEEFPDDEATDGPDVWVIDPLDGTDNYSRGQPQFCVSVAHTRRAQADVTAIYDPIRDEMFTALADGPARLNGRPIEVTGRTDPSESTVAWAQRGINPVDDRRFNAALAQAARTFHRVRLTGSAALETAWVAAGRYDGALFSNVKWWDHAGAGLLVRRAGGRVTDVRGAPTGPSSRRCIFSNGGVHRAILQIAASHGLERAFLPDA
ncbi:MAG: inositol monophosphatase [Chloroflexi bacterium]|nr:inositol monophosphatase [Chloroflexota bacterium]